jgi:2-oxoglutarate ferredoxin oxidoreductase subunit beta
LTDHDRSDFDKAGKKIREWDYNKDSPIALGVFYKKDAPTFEEGFVSAHEGPVERDAKIKKIMEEAV